MPQKRNPDAAELARAKTGRIMGALVALLTVMKGLPLAYAKDTQEDKEPVFDAADALALSLAAMAGMVRDLRPGPRRGCGRWPAAALPRRRTLADWLVRVLQLPFRTAHHVTGPPGGGKAEAKGCRPRRAHAWRRCRRRSRASPQALFDVLTVDASVASRTSYGGTAPANVAREAARWQAALAMSRARHRANGNLGACWRVLVPEAGMRSYAIGLPK